MTAHVIDDNWNLLDLTLSCLISDEHTAQGVLDQLCSDIQKYRINLPSVSALVTDTAANMNLLGDLVGDRNIHVLSLTLSVCLHGCVCVCLYVCVDLLPMDWLHRASA